MSGAYGSIIFYAKMGDISGVKYVARVSDIEQWDSGARTALWWAVHENHNDVAKYLLQTGARIYGSSCIRPDPLWWAAHNGNADMCRLLVEAGAVFDYDMAVNGVATAESPLEVARRLNREEVLKYFRILERQRSLEHSHWRDLHEVHKVLKERRMRGHWLLQWRRAVEAKRDARMVFQAARDGRPLELEKRLRLGKLAGGLEMEGEVTGKHEGSDSAVRPPEAARLGGHEDCVKLLEAVGTTVQTG